MSKLIQKFQAAPTEANRVRLANYLRQHMMATCMATADELTFLKSNGFAV